MTERLNPDAPTPPAEGTDGTTPKPRRRRASAATASPAAVEPAAVAGDVPAAAAGDEVPAAPRRRRAPRATPSASAAEASSDVSASRSSEALAAPTAGVGDAGSEARDEAPTPGDAPARPGRPPRPARGRRTSATDAGSTPEAARPSDGSVPSGEGPMGPAVDATRGGEAGTAAGRTDEPREGTGGDTAAQDGAAGEGRRKRHRNRRRNRRDKRDATAPEAVDAARLPPETPPPGKLPPTDVNELFADVLSGVYDDAADERAARAADELSADGEAAVAAPLAAPTAGFAGVDLDDAEPASSVDPAEMPAAGSAWPMPADGAPAAPGSPGPSASETGGAAGAARRVLAPEPDAPKLQKVLAQAGVGSRRDLEQMIVEGRIAVNGQAAHVGQRIRFGDRITLDGKPVKVRITPPPARVIAYHKPAGEVVTHDDPQARPTVFRRLPRLPRGKWQSVGRLDINTEGLLLFTNSGDLANRLMHPRFGVEREYAVRVLGTLTDEERERLLEGVEIDGQTASFRSITDGGGEGVNRWYRVVITEGRNREVRKLFDAVGKAVSRLIRIRYGSVVLPRGLRRGVWVDLGAEDIQALRAATGMPDRERDGRSGEGRSGDTRAGEGRGMAGDAERRGRRGGRRGRQARRDEPGFAGPRELGAPRGPDHDSDDDEVDHIGPIPNPLQQTYDKRAIQQARKQREYSEDGPIPNPLQQTYDKRAVQGERKPRRENSEDGPIPNPLQQTYDKRFAQGPKPAAKGGPRRKGGGGGGGGGAKRAAGGQPDPMRTAVGYIGGDAFLNKLRGGGPKGGRGRGGKGR